MEIIAQSSLWEITLPLTINVIVIVASLIIINVNSSNFSFAVKVPGWLEVVLTRTSKDTTPEDVNGIKD